MWSDTLSLIAPFEWHGNAKNLAAWFQDYQQVNNVNVLQFEIDEDYDTVVNPV